MLIRTLLPLSSPLSNEREISVGYLLCEAPQGPAPGKRYPTLISRPILSLIRWVICFGIVSIAVDSNGAEWKVGFSSVKITPERPVRMSGYASRTELSAGIATDLYAKAMAIEDSQGQRAVLVTADLIGFRADFAEPTCRRIMEQTGLQRDQIILNASHTHTGPTLGLDADQLGFPPDQAQATVEYSGELQRRLVELVSTSLERLEPATLSWGMGVATFVMNRREFTQRGVILGVNPRGLADRSVPVLRVDSVEGKLLGVLFGAACHNTTLTGSNLDLSGDFAGYAQLQVEMARDGVQAMFMQGCGGDANPFPRGSEELASLHGRSLGNEVLRVIDSKLQPVRGPLRTALAIAELPLASPATPDTYGAPIAVWQFGRDLTLVALPGEVVVDYVTLIERAIGPRQLWIAAYSNDVFGYLPSVQVLQDGGYETRGLYAGGVGLFAPEAQSAVVKTVRELARATGRPTDDAPVK